MLAIVVVGFWPTYFWLLLTGQGFEGHWVVHLHAWISLAWMALLISQTFLLARGRAAAHMRVGRLGFLLGVVVIGMAFLVVFLSMGRFVSAGIVSWPEAIPRARSPLSSVVTFAVLLGIGFAYRNRPAIHGRFMLLASVGLLFPATSRMEYLLGDWSAEMMFVVLIGLILILDIQRRGRIHAAYLVGILLLLPRLAVLVQLTLNPPPPP